MTGGLARARSGFGWVSRSRGSYPCGSSSRSQTSSSLPKRSSTTSSSQRLQRNTSPLTGHGVPYAYWLRPAHSLSGNGTYGVTRLSWLMCPSSGSRRSSTQSEPKVSP